MSKQQNSLIVKIRDTFSQPWIDYLLLCIIGLYVFRWFKGDFLYFGGDQIYPLNPNSNIYRIVYTWTSNGQGGSSALYIAQWFFYCTAYVFTKIGLSLAGAERLYYYLFYALNGLSMYYLASAVYPSNKDGKRIAYWISALFYMFNPVLVGAIPQADFAYSVFPLILGLFIKSVNTRFKDKIRLAFLASLFMFGFFLMLVDYSLFTLLFFSFLLYLCFNLKNLRNILLSTGIFFLILFLINLWLIVPLFFLLQVRGIAMIKAAATGSAGLGWEYQYLGLLRNIMVNALGFNARNVYNQPGIFILFINLLFAIIAFSALLIRPRSKNTIYFAILSIVGIIISNGPNPPFGKIFVWIIENIWILRTFRTTGYVMALTALGYSVLIGITVSKIYQMMQNHFYKTKSGTYKIRYAAPKIMVGLIIILVLINGWPLVTGDFFYQYKQWPGNAPVKIPYSYYTADKWLSQDNSQFYRIFLLPYIQAYHGYSWHPTWSPPIVPWIISKPYAVSDLLHNATSEDNYGTMVRLVGLLNVKYILIDGYDSRFNAELLTKFNPSDVVGYVNTHYEGMAGGYLYAYRFQQPQTGTLQSLSYYVGNAFDVKIALYSDAGNTPANLLTSVYETSGSPYSWNTVQVSSQDQITLTANTWYWMVFAQSSSNAVNHHPNSGQTTTEAYISGWSYSNSFPSTWSGGSYGTTADLAEVYWTYSHPLTTQNNQPMLQQVACFDKIYLYEINSTYFVPHIYASSNINLINGGSAQAVNFIDSGNFTAGKSVLFLSDQLSASDWHFIKGLTGNDEYTPEIVIKDVNPTKYMVHVNASRPFFLVLGESFDPYWVASINGKTINAHFTVNTYANAWYVNQTGTFNITLEYGSQYLFNIGIVISLTTLIVLCAYIFYPAYRRRLSFHKKIVM